MKQKSIVKISLGIAVAMAMATILLRQTSPVVKTTKIFSPKDIVKDAAMDKKAVSSHPSEIALSNAQQPAKSTLEEPHNDEQEHDPLKAAEKESSPAPIESPDLATHVGNVMQQSEVLKSRVIFDSATQQYIEETLLNSDLKYNKLIVKQYFLEDPRKSNSRPIRETIQAAEHFIVQVQEGSEEAFVEYIRNHNRAIVQKMGPRPLYLIQASRADFDVIEKETDELLSSELPVLVAEPDYLAFTTGTIPDDPSYSLLWGMDQANGFDINAPEGWDYHKGNDSVIVAVIDTGVDYTHVDLANNMWINGDEIPGNGIDDDANGYVDDLYGYDFGGNDSDPMDGGNHGTHVSGSIAAQGNNSLGVVGVNWQSKIMALRFIVGNSGFTSDAVEAVYYATDNGAFLSNNSWGGGGYSQSLKNAIDDANNNGILFIAAAGNDFLNNDVTPFYPSSMTSANIVAVTSIASHGGQVYNYGATSVDLGAPGYTIYSTVPGNGYGYANGTSMASPHVAGACALIKAAGPSLSHTQVRQLLLDQVTPTTSLSGKCVTGGRLNLFGSLQDLNTPKAPNALQTTLTESNQIDLVWSDQSDNETAFILERKDGSPLDVADESAESNHGNLFPDATFGPQHNAAGHYTFDGLGDAIIIPDSSSMDSGSGSVSISLWTRFDSLSPQTSSGFHIGALAGDGYLAGSVSGIGLYTLSERIAFQVRTAAGTVIQVASDGNHMDGLWHHVTAVLDRSSSTGIRIYIDGVLQAEKGDGTLFSGQNLDNDLDFVMGTRQTPLNSFLWPFVGDLDAARFYKGTALSQAQVTTLYQAGRDGARDIVDPSNLSLFTPFNQAAPSWNIVTTAPSNSTSYSDTSVTTNTLYNYRVKATNAMGTSDYADIASSTTPGEGGGGGGAPTAPAAPSSLNASAISSSQVDLTWVDNSTSETAFVIERSDGDFVEDPDPGFDVADASSNNNDGTLEPSVGSGPTAITDYYAFDGSDDLILIPDASSMDTGTEPASISIWTRFDSLAPQSSSGFHIGALAGEGYLAGSVSGMGLYTLNEQIAFQVRTTAGTVVQVLSDSSQMDGLWHHVTGVLDRSSATGIRIYIDGVLQTETGDGTLFSGQNLNNSVDFALGTRQKSAGSYQWYFEGDIDAARLYKGTALSQAQVTALYQAGRDGAEDTVDSTNLSLFMPFTQTASTWSVIATPTSNSTSYSDTSLTASTLYNYRVKATNAIGSSSYTDVASDTTTSGGPGAPTAPDAPSTLNATAISSSQVDLTWVDQATNETAFVIERSTGDFTEDPDPGFDIADASSNNNDGTLEPSVGSGPTANSDYYAFDGSDDLILIPDASSMDTGTESASISIWTRFDSLAPQSSSGFHIGALAGEGYLAGSVSGMGLYTLNEQIAFQVRTTAGTVVQVLADNSQMDGLWHHVTGVLDRSSATGIRIYIDGVLQTETGDGTLFNGQNLNNSVDFALGTRQKSAGSYQWYFEGDLDAARLYKGTALSQAQVTALYQAGREGAKDTIDSSNLSLFMPFTQTASSWTVIASTSSNSASYSDTSVFQNTLYNYRVKATNTVGSSSYTDVASDTTPGGGPGAPTAPAAPSALNATAISSSQVDLTWTDHATNETAFVIERSDGDFLEDPDPGFDVADASSNNNDGTLEPSVGSGPTANSDYYAFDGSDDLLLIPDASTMDTGTEPASISIWTRFDSLAPQSTSGFHIGALAGEGYLAGNVSGMGLYTLNEQIAFQVRTTAGAVVQVLSDSSQMDGLWHHVTGVLDRSSATGIRIYIDGVLQTETGDGTLFNGQNLDNSVDFALGTRQKSPGSYQWYFEGDLDAPRLYKGTALSQAQVTALYQAGREGAKDSIDSSNLSLFMPFTQTASSWNVIASVTSNSTSYSDTSVFQNTLYNYRVKATNTIGSSSYTDVASDTTPSGGPGAPTAPATPSTLNAATISSNQVDLTWTDNATNETAFVIERSTGDLIEDPDPGFDIADVSSNNNDGTLEPSVGSGPTANTDYYAFDGSDDLILIPDSSTIDSGTGAASISIWARFDSLAPQSTSGFHIGALAGEGYLAGNVSGMGLYTLNEQIAFQVRTTAGTVVQVLSDSSQMDGFWHHVTGVLDRNSATGIRIYIDGVLQTETGDGTLFSGQNLNNSVDFALGTRQKSAGSYQWYFEGDLDAPRIYKGTALSQAQVTALYQAGREGFKNTIDSSNLSLFMPFTQTAPAWNVIASTASNTTSYSDTSVTTNTLYNYRVKATNTVGSSSYSNIASSDGSMTAGQIEVNDAQQLTIDAGTESIRLSISQHSRSNPLDASKSNSGSPDIILHWNSSPNEVFSILHSTNLNEEFEIWESNIQATPPMNETSIYGLSSEAHYFIIKKN